MIAVHIVGGDDRGHRGLAASWRRMACWRRRPSSTSCRGLATEPRSARGAGRAAPRRWRPDRCSTMLRLEPAVRRLPAAAGGRIDPTVAVLPAVPAGRYRVRVEGGGSGGWLMLGIGQDQFALRSEALTWPAPPIEIEFPVDVRALIVRGDEDARRGRPPCGRRAAVDRAGARASDRPRRAARGEVRRCVGVLSRRSQLRGAGRVLGRREPAVDVRRAGRPAAVVGRPAPAQRAGRESPDARVRPVARGA